MHSASFSNMNDISFPFHVDSAATAHMESNHSLFTRYRPYNPPLILKLANDNTVLAPGWGFITLALDNDGRHESIELPFLHVPDLWCTLISISALASQSIFFETDAEGGRMHHADRTVIAHVNCSAGLYYLQAMHTHTAFAVRSIVTMPLPLAVWHARMGHAANSTLRKAEKVVKGLSLDPLEKSTGPGDHIDCPSCLMGKQKRLPFPSHARQRATHVAELIHTDVWGPVNIATLSGETFFIAFTDDFSHFSTVYFMKHKSKVYSHVQ
jgi:hypothetical protein